MRLRHTAPVATVMVLPSIVVSVEALEPRQFLSASTTITIGTTRAQTIDGFGTSLGAMYSPKMAKDPKFQKLLYQDLGASMFRVALNPWVLKGGAKGHKSMGTPVNLGPNLQANINQFNFNDTNILRYGTVARAAAKYGSDVKIIGSVWSPPFWMKGVEVSPITGKSNGVKPTFTDKTSNTSGGSLVATDANLTQFGRYVAAYVRGFEQAFGVKMYAISIQNELAFHEFYSSCVYSPDLYVKAVKAVSRWFKKFGITTKIMGPEDVGVGATNNRGILARQMKYIEAVRRDPEAMAAVELYAIHGYANDGVTNQRSPAMWSQYYTGSSAKSGYFHWTGIKADHKPSWMTESSGYVNNWDAAMRLAGGIQDALIQANTSAYVYWGISSSKGTSSEALTTGTNPKAFPYTAFKHFSQMIRPGAVRLQTSPVDPNGVYVSAFADDLRKTLTTVLVNESDQTQTVHLKLSGIALSRFTRSYESTSSFVWKRLKTITASGGEVVISMPPKSLFTLQGSTGTITTAGAVSGVYFMDKNGNGKKESTEAGIGGDKIFIDLNNNGTRSPHEPFVATAADGSFTIGGLAPGSYIVRRDVPPGYSLTTGASLNVTVKSGKTTGGLLIGLKKNTAPNPGGGSTGSIKGRAFSDSNGNGKKDPNDPFSGGKTVFLDTNNNGKLDSGEKSVTTDIGGNFSFTGLLAGTYHVRRVLPKGFAYSTKLIDQLLTTGQQVSGLLIGSKPTG